jgi:SAM-dependent methyltransferase
MQRFSFARALVQDSPRSAEYVSVDTEPGPGVDIVSADPYIIPLETGWADACLASSCFEHSEFFWLLVNEAFRVLKPTGLLFVTAPANGSYHRFPVDCWRFYPDSGLALQNWVRRSGTPAILLESFVGLQSRSRGTISSASL